MKNQLTILTLIYFFSVNVLSSPVSKELKNENRSEIKKSIFDITIISQQHASEDLIKEINNIRDDKQSDKSIDDGKFDSFILNFRNTYASQISIYKELYHILQESPDAFVYVEGAYKLPTADQCQEISKKFNSFNDENPTLIQALDLVKFGPSIILYCNGYLKNFRPAEDVMTYARAMLSDLKLKAFTKGLSKEFDIHDTWERNIYENREKCVINKIEQDLEQDKDHKIIVIFGADHSFSEAIKDKKYNYRLFIKNKTWEKAFFNETIDFVLSDNERLSSEDDYYHRLALATSLIEMYYKLKIIIIKINQMALINEVEAQKLEYERYLEYFHMNEEESPSLKEMRAKYIEFQIIKNIDESKSLDEFMTKIVPIYNPRYSWQLESGIVKQR